MTVPLKKNFQNADLLLTRRPPRSYTPPRLRLWGGGDSRLGEGREADSSHFQQEVRMAKKKAKKAKKKSKAKKKAPKKKGSKKK